MRMKTAVFLIASLALPPTSGASPAQAGGVSSGGGQVLVTRLDAGEMDVELGDVRDRRAILVAICEAAEAVCTLPDAIPSPFAGPSRLRGSLAALADEVLKGAGFSFASGGLSRGPVRSVLVVTDSRAERSAATAAAAAVVGGATTTLDARTEEVPGVETAADLETPAADDDAADRLPGSVASAFFGPDGRPIYSAGPPKPAGLATVPTVTEFVRPDGSPFVAPAATALSTVSEFTRVDGSPIPLSPGSGGGMTMSPFVGADGRLIPMPARRPSDK